MIKSRVLHCPWLIQHPYLVQHCIEGGHWQTIETTTSAEVAIALAKARVDGEVIIAQFSSGDETPSATPAAQS